MASIATLIFVALGALQGFKDLQASDNDSMLRLVEVRDLLAGQGWFDLHQYRMGAEGGFLIHWSRLVDAPIAALLAGFSALTGDAATGETLARIAWPALLFGANLVFIMRAARNYAGEHAVVPSLVIGAATLYFTGLFAPGALDHHNIQLVLVTASLAFLLGSRRQPLSALGAGICAALSMAIGMETAPYVAVAGISVAGLFLLDANERTTARGFGLGLSVASAVVFAATIAPWQWGAVYCDAFSAFHFVVAVLAGLGLAAIASVPALAERPAGRVTALLMLGGLLGAVVVTYFPHCISAPFADVDPRLKDLWFGNIVETQSLMQLLVSDPVSAMGRYITPLFAGCLLALRARRDVWRREDGIVAAMLGAAFLVSIWQIRGSNFSIVMAVVPLAAWVGLWRHRAAAQPSLSNTLRMVGVWLVSINIVWGGVGAAASMVIEDGSGADADTTTADSGCRREQDYQTLAILPATTVLAIANSGPRILAYTKHRALSGLYHREVVGNLAALAAFTGSTDAARAIIAAHHVGLVALCRGNGETSLYTDMAPNGLMADLMKGKLPPWLELVGSTQDQPLVLYRVLAN